MGRKAQSQVLQRFTYVLLILSFCWMLSWLYFVFGVPVSMKNTKFINITKLNFDQDKTLL